MWPRELRFSSNGRRSLLCGVLSILLWVSPCLVSRVSCLSSVAWAASEEEDLYLIKRAFEDHFHEVVVEQSERFIGAYPRSAYRHEVLLLLGQSCHALGRYYKALGVLESLRMNASTPPAVRAAALFWAGEVHLKGGDQAAARRYYEEVLAAPDPNDHRMYAEYSIAWSFYEEGRVEEALQRFRSFVKRYVEQPMAVDAKIKIAQCLYRLKRYSEASEQLSAFLQQHPGSPQFAEALYLLGESLYYQQSYDRAGEYYRQALAMSPSSAWAPYAQYGVIWSLFHREQYAESLAACQAFWQRFANDPLSDGVMFVEGASLSRMERSAEAADVFARLTDTYPTSDWCDDAWLWWGEALFRVGRYAGAAATYRTALAQLGSEQSDVMDELGYNLGWALVQDGRFDEAREAFGQVVERNSDEQLVVSSLCRLGDLAYDERDYQHAIEAYDRVLKEHPDSYFADIAQYQLGLCLVQLGREDDARLAFQSLLSHFTGSKWSGQARLQLGMAFFRQHNYQRAIEEWELLLADRQGDPELKAQALFQIGNACYNAGEYARAKTVYQQVLSEHADQAVAPSAHYQLAWTVAQQGDIPEAKRQFQRYLEQNPSSEFVPDVIFWLGEQAMQEREFDVARQQFRRIVAEFGRSELADDAIYWIGQAFVEQERVSEAVEQFGALIEQYPGSALVPEVVLAMGALYDAEGRDADARQQWEWVIDRYPQTQFQALACQRITEQLRRKGDYVGAVVYLEKAMSAATPEFGAQLQYVLAECHQEMGSLDQALQEYLKVDYLYPENAYWSRRARLKAAQICEAKQLWEQARGIYERLAREPVEEARYAQERLQWLNRYVGNSQTAGGS